MTFLRSRSTQAAAGVGLVLVCTPLAPARAASQFELPFASYPVGRSIGAMAVVDLNADGLPDWIVVHAALRTVEIFPGTPGGGFRPTSNPIQWQNDELWGCTALSVADVDGDGILDFVMSGSGVGMLRGLGHFEYEFRSLLPELRGVYVPGSVLGDVDADGDLDFVVSTYQGGPKVETWLRNGTGTFHHGPATAFTQLNPTTRSGHFDPGPTLDIVVAGERGAFALLAQPDASLAVAGRVGGPAYTLALATGDFDGDGIDDMALADENGLLGAYSGAGFGHGTVLSNSGPHAVDIAVADFNGDGFRDVAALRGDASRIDLYFGRGNGDFDAAVPVPTTTAPGRIMAADVDGDGLPELFVTSATTGAVHYGRDAYRAPGRVFEMGGHPASVAVADWNADGILDLATTDPVQGDLVFRMGSGAAAFLPPARSPVGGTPSALRSGDWNHDRVPDLLFTDRSTERLACIPSLPGGGMGAPVVLPVPRTTSLDLGDFDGDGLLDVTGVSSDETPLQLVWAATSDGKGGIRTQSAYELPARPETVRLGDWNMDGAPDLLVACPDANQVWWLPANGDGTFQPASLLVTRPGPADVLCADLDADGRPELAVAHDGDRGLTLFSKTADGGVDGGFPFATNGPTAQLRFADLDGNGGPELYFTALHYGTLCVRDNAAGAPHGVIREIPSGHASAVVAADDNGDGLPEFWIADDGTGTVLRLANLGVRTPAFGADVVVTASLGRLTFEWHVGEAAGAAQVATLERAPGGTGPWTARASAGVSGTTIAVSDTRSMADAWYRLRLQFPAGDQWSAPVFVAAAAAPAAQLAVPREHDGRLALGFQFGPAPSARLEVFDIRGRRLAAWRLPAQGTTTGEIVWDRRDTAGARVGRGVVFVHLDAGGTQRVRKAVLHDR